MTQFRCLDIIWGLLNLIAWQPNNNVQNDHPRSCSINHKLGGGFKYCMFYVSPYLGKIPILTNIFQRGWNHQPVRLLRPNVSSLFLAIMTQLPKPPTWGKVPLWPAYFQVRLLNPRVTALVRQSGRVTLSGSSDLVGEIQVSFAEGFPFMWLHVS